MDSSNITTLRLDGFVPDAEIRAAAQEVHRAIYKIRDTNLLVERLLAKILEVIPAKRGAVLLPDVTPSFRRRGGSIRPSWSILLPWCARR